MELVRIRLVDSMHQCWKCLELFPQCRYRNTLQFQPAPDFLLESCPLLRSHRFLHGILSTEHGPATHFMTVYGHTGADVLALAVPARIHHMTSCDQCDMTGGKGVKAHRQPMSEQPKTEELV